MQNSLILWYSWTCEQIFVNTFLFYAYTPLQKIVWQNYLVGTSTQGLEQFCDDGGWGLGLLDNVRDILFTRTFAMLYTASCQILSEDIWFQTQSPQTIDIKSVWYPKLVNTESCLISKPSHQPFYQSRGKSGIKETKWW